MAGIYDLERENERDLQNMMEEFKVDPNETPPQSLRNFFEESSNHSSAGLINQPKNKEISVNRLGTPHAEGGSASGSGSKRQFLNY